MLVIKILSLGTAERYAVRRMVTAAYQDLLVRSPKQEIEILDVSDSAEIGRYALVLVLPTLVINEKVVCSGRFPDRKEILGWLQEATNTVHHQ